MLTLWKIKEFGSMNASAEYLCIYFALILETNNVSADTLPKYYRRQNSGGRTLLTFRQHTSNGNNASADTLPTYFRNPSDLLALEAHWPTLPTYYQQLQRVGLHPTDSLPTPFVLTHK